MIAAPSDHPIFVSSSSASGSNRATSESLPSPYPSRTRPRAGKAVHLRITAAGLATLALAGSDK